MDKHQFRMMVMTQTPPWLREACPQVLDTALRHYVWRGRTEQSYISDCIGLAGEIAELVQTLPAASGHTPEVKRDADQSLAILQERLLEAFRPVVERVRCHIFGSPEPPFASYAAAVEWLEKADKEQSRPSPQDANAYKKLRKKIDAHIAALERLAHQEVQLIEPVREIPYLKPVTVGAEQRLEYRTLEVFSTNHLAVPFLTHPLADTSLGLIEKLTRGMTGWNDTMTGFSKLNCVAYCLVGTKPPFRTAKYRLRRIPMRLLDKQLHLTYATVEFYTPHLTDQLLREVVKCIRRDWGMTRTKALTPKDKQFLDTIERLGGVPEPPTKAFWEQVRQEDSAHYKTWHGPRMKYKRLQERLARL